MQSFAYMWKEEGYKGLFKGNGTNVARAAPFTAFEFFFYDFFKKLLFPNISSKDFTAKFICGGLTGITASTIVIVSKII